MLKKIKQFWPESLIFLFSFITRFYNLGYPPTYYFDEVYHAFTAEQMYKGNPAAWEWWNPNPPGFAYEWTHPPLAKEFMWFAISIFGDKPFAWRFFSAFFGFGSIVLIYFIAKHFFNRKVALLSSAVASLSGLLLVMSRIAMNDSYFLFFSLLAILMFLKDKKLLMGIFLGLSLASKWTASFTILILSIIFFIQNYRGFDKFLKFLITFVLELLTMPFSLTLFFSKNENFKKPLWFAAALFIVPIIYLASYTPFFLGHHSPPGLNYSNFQTFIGLQQQMWWYHTQLKATHTYQSTPLQWIFDLRPVWLYVNYQGNTVASIFTLDNPLIPWFGLVSVIFLIFQIIKRFSLGIFFVILSYLFYFIFWIKSPRIMFNYHYLPSTAFLTIAIGLVLNELINDKKGKIFAWIFLTALLVSFVYFFPIWHGVHLETSSYNSHFWISSWK